jgi:hypothetical protein
MHVICKFSTASELLFSLTSWTGTSVGSTAGAETSGQTFYDLPTSSGSDGSSAFLSPSPVYGPPAPLVTSGGVSSSSSVSTAQENIGPQTSPAATASGFASGSSSVAGITPSGIPPSGIQEHSVVFYAPSLPSQLSEFPSVFTAAAGDFSSAGTGNVVGPVIPVSHASSFAVAPAAAEAVGYSSYAGSSASQGNAGVNFSPVHSYSVPAATHSGKVEASFAGALSSQVPANAGNSFISTSSFAVPSSAPAGAESSSFVGSSTQENQGYAEIVFSPATSYSAPETTKGFTTASSFSGHASSAVQQNFGDNFAPIASHGAPAATSAGLSSAQGHTGVVSAVPFAVQHSYGIPRLQ